jgi:hypothetical protein
MSRELPQAYMVHSTARRLRLRVPDIVADAEASLSLSAALDQAGAFDHIDIRASTGSIILEFECPEAAAMAAVRRCLKVEEPNTLREAPPEPPIERAKRYVDQLDRNLSGGGLDLANVTFVLLCVAAAVQAARGSFLAPASGLLWNALALAVRSPRQGVETE